jgi:hypothetical protein
MGSFNRDDHDKRGDGAAGQSGRRCSFSRANACAGGRGCCAAGTRAIAVDGERCRGLLRPLLVARIGTSLTHADAAARTRMVPNNPRRPLHPRRRGPLLRGFLSSLSWARARAGGRRVVLGAAEHLPRSQCLLRPSGAGRAPARVRRRDSGLVPRQRCRAGCRDTRRRARG